MYKYKKTIILNNRRRRIFSKEKSNAEYILYKNDYITLNAYNKKTGGSLTSLTSYNVWNPKNTLMRRYTGEPDQIDIPNSILNSNNIELNKYDENNSNIILTYLKSKSLINDKTDKIYWVVLRKDDKKMTVKGYTQSEIIKDGKEMTNEMFYRYIDKYYESLNFQNYDKIKILNLFLTNYLNIPNNIKIPNDIPEFEKSDIIIHFKDYNINNSLYKQLEANNYYIYYVIEDKIDLKLDVEHKEILTKYNKYIEGGFYELFKDTIFKCTKINKIDDIDDIDDKYNKYDIVFKYITCSISDLINKSAQIQSLNPNIYQPSEFYETTATTKSNGDDGNGDGDGDGDGDEVKKEELISYGKEMTNKMFLNYIKKYHKSSNFEALKVQILYLFLTNYLNLNIPKKISNLENSGILYFRDYYTSKQLSKQLNNSLYKDLEADNYYIYYVIEDREDLKLDVEHKEILTKYDEYIEGGYYELFEDSIFKCTKINKRYDKEDMYDIVFKYITCSISDLIDESKQIQSSESNLIEYGIRKHQEIFENYNKNTSQTIDYFNKLIKANVDNNKILYYYNLANNDNTKEIYNELSRIGYYIYTLKRNITTDTKHQNYNINNAIFRYIGYYTIDDDKISVLQYILADTSSGGGQRKLKNIKFKKNLK